LAGLDGDRARGDHHVDAAAAPPAAAGAAGLRATRPRAPRRSPRCARSVPSWTRGRWRPPSRSAACTWIRRSRCRTSGTRRCSGRSTTRRSTRSRPTRSRARRLFAELRQLGGALARVPEAPGRPGRSSATTSTSAPGRRSSRRWGGRARGRRARARGALRVRDRGRVPQLRERAVDPLAFFSAGTYERLRAIRAAVDPHGVMVSDHAIPAA
jgi:hypothetical protein